MDFQAEIEATLKNLQKISDQIEKIPVAPEIRKLASLFEKGLEEKKPYILAKFKTTLVNNNIRDDPSVTHISLVIKKLKGEHFPNISDSWIEKVLDDKYKIANMRNNMGFQRKVSVEELTDDDILLQKEDLKDRIRKLEAGPAKDIKVKINKGEFETYNWKSPLALEIAKLATKMEIEFIEGKHDVKLIEKVAKHIRTARDGRYATTLQAYEAMIVAANSTKSLKNVCEGEWEFKGRWDIHDDEKNCRECRFNIEQCRAGKCKCICHDVVKELTTKGLKYAIKTDEYLTDLKNKMKSVANNDYDGLCEFGKILIYNPEQSKRLSKLDKKNILLAHIKKDVCEQCSVDKIK